MMGLSAKIHKWLALLMAVQILFWFVSGLFFASSRSSGCAASMR